jgi:glucose-6-phosphate 1-dehydrogenase
MSELSERMLVSPFDFIVFGGTGDLAMRKLFPSLYYRERDRQMTDDSRIFAVSRSRLSRDEFRIAVDKALHQFIPAEDYDDAIAARLALRLDHVSINVTGSEGWDELHAALQGADSKVRVYYLAVSPSLFGGICDGLKAHDLITDASRLVLEKPIGKDRASANEVNDRVGRAFPEDRIFRIDHYLGKESVQNLMVLRFGNALFEPLWNSGWIDNVQITVAESIGVGDRAEYYDNSGALRDMVQNHFLQLLCLVAMDPPGRLDKDEIRNEKIKVLRALKPIGPVEIRQNTVRGQYGKGVIDGRSVPGYLSELTEASGRASSNTETFTVIKAEVANWRWAGVPFYLRTGKRLPVRCSEIVVQFKAVPHNVFDPSAGELQSNLLVIRLQPNEGVKLQVMTKVPGPGGLRLRAVPLNLAFADAFKDRYPDAYERLLMDVVRGNPSLFMRRDEVDAAWAWIDTIQAAWRQTEMKPEIYPAGSWGPLNGALMLARENRSWHDIEL